MKTKRALFGAVLLIVTSSLPIHGQVPSATLALTVEPSVVMAEKTLTLEAILTNHSDKQMFFGLSFSCGFEPPCASSPATKIWSRSHASAIRTSA
jgi:hypothetical protein